MAAQEKPVKKRGLTLRILKFPLSLFGDNGCSPHTRKVQVTETPLDVKRARSTIPVSTGPDVRSMFASRSFPGIAKTRVHECRF